MSREFMCEYGNCENTDVPLVVSERDGQRRRYCCSLHAACSLLYNAYIQSRNGDNQALMIVTDGALQDLRPIADKVKGVRGDT